MGALINLLLPELQRRFPNRGIETIEDDRPHLRFPAIHPEVGDVEIYDDGDELTVVYGNFTHCHYDEYLRVSDQWQVDAVNAVIADLEALFSDRLRMWGSPETAGGILREGDEEESLWEPGDPQYVWSGPVKDAD